MILSLLSVKVLPRGEERIRRSQARGCKGDDPALPIRWLTTTRAGKTLSVAVGPVDYGERDEELFETLLEIR